MAMLQTLESFSNWKVGSSNRNSLGCVWIKYFVLEVYFLKVIFLSFSLFSLYTVILFILSIRQYWLGEHQNSKSFLVYYRKNNFFLRVILILWYRLNQSQSKKIYQVREIFIFLTRFVAVADKCSVMSNSLQPHGL